MSDSSVILIAMQYKVFNDRILPLKDKFFRLALSITGNRQDAEDIVQDALLHVLNKQDHWHTINNIEAYCFRAIRNLSLDALALKDRQTGSIPENIEYPDVKNVEEQLSANEEMKLIHELIDQLPEKQKTIMQLRDIEGLSYKEISEVMEISEEQVKVNLFRTRQKIKEHFMAIYNYGIK